MTTNAFIGTRQEARGSVLRTVAALVLSTLCYAVLSGSSCVAVYCSDDCDPCVSVTQCKCGGTCPNAPTVAAVHRLETFRWSLSRDAAGNEVESYDQILGLSLERALGARVFDEHELLQFTRTVIEVNAARLRVVPSACTFEGLDRCATGTIVGFTAREAQTPASTTQAPLSLAFFYDRAGNLLEVGRSRNVP